jgi:hypothetical protein
VKIFGNIEEILLCNAKIYSMLESVQKKDNYKVKCIGHVLVDHLNESGSDTIESYKKYCCNLSYRSQKLIKKRNNIKLFGDFLKVFPPILLF